MKYHLYYDILEESHVIWDDEDVEKMKEKIEIFQYREEKNREYSLEEMKLILKVERLKHLKKRYDKYKAEMKKLEHISRDDERMPDYQNAMLMMGRARHLIFTEIDNIDINDFL